MKVFHALIPNEKPIYSITLTTLAKKIIKKRKKEKVPETSTKKHSDTPNHKLFTGMSAIVPKDNEVGLNE